MSLLVQCEILGHFVNTSAANSNCSLRNSDYAMQLSKKQKMFSEFFAIVLKSASIFEHFEKKSTS